jgi:IclR family acetate operon transcriptional repressor
LWGSEQVATEQDGAGAGRYTVKSVARALRLVGIVADGPADGQTLSELAAALGISKSSTLALARTLEAAGFLRETRPGPRYTLGTALIRLGDIVGRQLPLGDLCRPLLDELSETTKMTARIAVAEAGYPVFIARVDGPGSVRFYTPLGQREVPYASAAGKAILCTPGGSASPSTTRKTPRASSARVRPSSATTAVARAR